MFLENTSIDRTEPLVEIGAYALMPNHPHLILKQVADGGIARFMQKVFTGYTMYFNLKNKRTGALFAGTYKSRHISNDQYLKQAISYVLLNPAELFADDWKKGMIDLSQIREPLLAYRFSSLSDFLGSKRQENKIVTEMGEFYEKKPTLDEMLSYAISYHQENPADTEV